MKKILFYSVLCPIIFLSSVHGADRQEVTQSLLQFPVPAGRTPSETELTSFLKQTLVGTHGLGSSPTQVSDAFSISPANSVFSSGANSPIPQEARRQLSDFGNQNFPGVYQSILDKNDGILSLSCKGNVPVKILPAGLALWLASRVCPSISTTRMVDGATVMSSLAFLAMLGTAGYIFKNMVYDEMSTIVSYKKDIDKLCSAMKFLQEQALPDLMAQNAQLHEKLSVLDAVVETIQRSIKSIMENDKKIIDFHQGLIEELEKVQAYCKEYQDMKRAIEENDLSHNASHGSLPTSQLVESSSHDTHSIASDDTEKYKKRHGLLSNFRIKVFGSKHEEEKSK